MKVIIEHTVNSLWEALQAVIRYSGTKQGTFAEILEMDKGAFSRKYNNPGGPVAQILGELELILREAKQGTFAQYAAEVSKPDADNARPTDHKEAPLKVGGECHHKPGV